MEEKSVEKILWDGITLKGIDKWSDKLRVYWFIVSFVLFGSVVKKICTRNKIRFTGVKES